MNGPEDASGHATLLKDALLELRRLQAELDAFEQQRFEPIAIIGMGCRFPGAARDPESFWRLLNEGHDAIADLPTGRWDAALYDDPNPDVPGKMYTTRGGYIEDVDVFDAPFFGLVPREAVGMDPQQRLLLTVSWEALEHAAQAPDRLDGSRTGVFMGIGTDDYAQLSLYAGDPSRIDAYTSLGNARSIAVGRLAYVLGLHGPTLQVDTSCSSALVAVHLACQSLRAGECDLALAGGVNLILTPTMSIGLCKLRALAPDGRCKTFDASANGYVRGEGCGIVVLKRLADAIANRDTILAYIRGSAVNHDGRSNGLTAPSGVAQEAVMRQAIEGARIDPVQVHYLEAHGTGTSLGDPIEVMAAAAVYGAGRRPEQPLVMGSVKPHIGHLEAAAGVAGLMKVVLALQHLEIPPHLHCTQPNPHIPWSTLPITVPLERLSWAASTGRRLAAVSAFGMSGTNAHVIVEEAPLLQPSPAASLPATHLLALSAKTATSLTQLTQRYTHVLAQQPDLSLADLCYTANTGRSHFRHRLAITAAALPELHDRLRDHRHQAGPHDLDPEPCQPWRSPQAVFLFTGQGAQSIGMGKSLYQACPTFRDILDHCDDVLRSTCEMSLLAAMFGERPEADRIHHTSYAQPALFALEYALAQTWRSWGIEPAVVCGHSVGEYAAACVAGLFSLEDGLACIAERGRLMGHLPRGGAMATIFAAEAVVAETIQPYAAELAIAALNGPEQVVISGAQAALQRAVQRFEAQGISTLALTVSHAFHSPLMEPVLTPFEAAMRQVAFATPTLPLISNLTGQPVDDGVLASPSYWSRHLREPVRFADGMRHLIEAGYRIFIEVGPHPVLTRIARASMALDAYSWLPSLRQGKDDWQQMVESLGALYELGADVDWQALYPPRFHTRLALPTYPFEQQRYWCESSHPSAGVETAALAIAPDEPEALSPSVSQLTWVPTAWPEDVPSACGQHWLLFCDAGHVGEALVQALEQRGALCYRVYRGPQRRARSERCWELDANRADDLDDLFTAILGTRTRHLDGIVYLWGLDLHDRVPMVAADPADEAAVYGSVLRLIQVLARSVWSGPVRTWLITSGAQPVDIDGDDLALAQAPLWGLGRVLRTEHGLFWGGVIDLPVAETARYAARVASELLHPRDEDELIVRADQCWVARLRHLPLKDGAADPFVVRPDATYLITGGLGALGLAMARWFADQGARHLVLVSRGTPSPSVLHTLRAIEAQGTQVVTQACDVAEAQQVQDLMQTIDATLPPVRGVVHAAGVLDDGVLMHQSWERFAHVFAAKVKGTWNLHRHTRALPLDCFILFSSAASLLGPAGQGNYAAASAFLDLFAAYREAHRLPVLSLNWGPWAGGGMTSHLSETLVQRLTASGIDTLSTPVALHTLHRLLDHRVSHACVIQVDWPRFAASLLAMPQMLRELVEGARPHAAPRSIVSRLQQTAPEHRQSVLERHIADELRRIMQLSPTERLDIHHGFLDMGMDSLMAAELHNRLALALEHPFPAIIVFNHPTIAHLAAWLIAQLFPPGPRPSVVDRADAASSSLVAAESWDDLARLPAPTVERLLLEKLDHLRHRALIS